MAEVRATRRGAEELRDFSVRLLGRLGALVEQAEGGPVEALLPEELARRLGRDELLVLGAGPEAPEGAERLVFGAPLVDRLFEMAGERLVPVAEVDLSDGAHTPMSVAEQAAREQLALQNTSLRAVRAQAARGQVLLLTFHYQAQCEDTADGLVEVAVDAATGLPLKGLGRLQELLRDAKPHWRGEPLAEPERIAEAARRLVEPAVLERIAEFRTGVERHRLQDAERLHRYYTGLLQDLQGARTGGAEAAAAQLEQKAQAVRRDYALKCQELRLRARIEVRIRLVAVLRIGLPGAVVELDLLRRKTSFTTRTRYVPALRELVPPACMACHGPCGRLWACDEGHALCDRPSCFGPCAACGKQTCPVCHKGPTCKSCGQPRGGAKPAGPRPEAEGASLPAPAAPAGPAQGVQGPAAAPTGASVAEPGVPEPSPSKARRAARIREPSAPKPSEPQGETRGAAAERGPGRPKSGSTTAPSGSRAKPPAREPVGAAATLADLLKRTGSVKPAEARDTLGLDAQQLRKAIAELVEQGRAAVEGHARGTTYRWIGP
jgi:hypothetical protein